MGVTELKAAVNDYVSRRPPFVGLHGTEHPRLGLFHQVGTTEPSHALYHPSLCAVVQGAKQVALGEETFAYREGQALVVSLDLPILSHVIEASGAEPYLAIALAFDTAMLQEVLEQLPGRVAVQAPVRSLAVHDLSDAALDCLARLLRCLDTPGGMAILFPAIQRELYYHLLTGPRGAEIAQLALPSTHTYRIARAAHHLRYHFAEAIRIDQLAESAGMSASSFHAHFKAATGLSPLQFQKQLRLMEARRLLLAEGLSAAEACLRVGYESASQFTREYSRMFGAPPKRSLKELQVMSA